MCRVLEIVNKIIQHDAKLFISDDQNIQFKQNNMYGFVQDYVSKNKT
jgi:hypothetical protein